MSKQEELLQLAQKGGNDAHLFLLDKLQALQNELDLHIENMQYMFDEQAKEIEMLQNRLTTLEKTNEILTQLLEEAKKEKDISATINFV